MTTRTATWHDALTIAKTLQEERRIPIFAMTFKGMCSCCADPKHFNPEAYLYKNTRRKNWKEIDSYIILFNSGNGHGEADLTHPENTPFGKLWEYSEWENNQAKRIYVRYCFGKKLNMETLNSILTRFVECINERSDEKWEYIAPENELAELITSYQAETLHVLATAQDWVSIDTERRRKAISTSSDS